VRTPRKRHLRSGGPLRSCGKPEDMQSRRFETVRPRVQIPGPRPVFEFRVVRWDFTQDAPRRRRVTEASQILEKFGGGSSFAVVRSPRLNLRVDTGQPIYQHAHGPGTVRHEVRKSDASWATHRAGRRPPTPPGSAEV